jgi:thiamine biosynthesis lipoprotein
MRASAALLVLFLANACGREPLRGERIEGEAAGASFVVQLAERIPANERAEIQKAVAEALDRVSSKTSTSLPESDLSRLNRAAAGAEVPVSVETFEILREAVRVSELTGGAFDVTLAPLARLWGFGPGASMRGEPPTEEEITTALARVGFRNLELDDDSITVTKRMESVECDLSGIATGFALDLAAALLEERGYRDYWIQSGSRVRTRGKDAASEPWLASILRPGPGGGEIQRNVPLSGFSMATSGDYRGADAPESLPGKLHAHLVDPRSARPLDHGLLSVTVLGETCMTVEALATGLLVLGPEEGFRLAADEGLAALFLVHSSTGALEERATPAFAELFD